jgi:hypothetical protein
MKIESAILYFSEDIKFMGVYNIVKEEAQVVSMQDCTGISVGTKTERFQTYH